MNDARPVSTDPWKNPRIRGFFRLRRSTRATRLRVPALFAARGETVLLIGARLMRRLLARRGRWIVRHGGRRRGGARLHPRRFGARRGHARRFHPRRFDLRTRRGGRRAIFVARRGRRDFLARRFGRTHCVSGRRPR
ncbi:hypothetical protein, partial [Burkholderia pseudomallei]|uniref:hypothetical protein n=2 Tax=Burkholderia pseudomallei TaxID=28450 RepID=UPI001955389E